MAYQNNIISWIKKIRELEDVSNLKKYISDLFSAKDYNVYFTSGRRENYSVIIRMCSDSFKRNLNTTMNLLLIANEIPEVEDQLSKMEINHELSVTKLGLNNKLTIDPDLVSLHLQENTGLVVMPYSSLFFGTIYPIQAVAKIVAAKTVPVCVDFTDLFGKVNINLPQKKISALMVDLSEFIPGFGFVLIQKKMQDVYQMRSLFFGDLFSRDRDLVYCMLADKVIKDLIANQRKYNDAVKKLKCQITSKIKFSQKIPDRDQTFISGNENILFGVQKNTHPYRIAFFTTKKINTNLDFLKYEGDANLVNINSEVLRKSISLKINPAIKKKDIDELILSLVP